MNTILISDPLSGAVPVKSKRGMKILTASNTPQPLTTRTDLWLSKLWLYPGKSILGSLLVANTDAIHVGKKSVVLANGFSDMVEVATTGDTAAIGVYLWNGVSKYVLVGDSTYTILLNGTTGLWNLNHNATTLATASTLTGAWTITGSGTTPAPIVTESNPTPVPIDATNDYVAVELPGVRDGQRMSLADVVVQGTSGDGVFYEFT